VNKLLIASVLALLLGCNGRRENALPAPAAPGSDMPAPPATEFPSPKKEDVLAVQDVLEDPIAYSERMVRVRGRCLGWNGPAAGPGPWTRSDWQLGNTEQALWIVGPLPPGCTGPEGGGDVVVDGRVHVDSLRGNPRPYLVRPRP
jgi:hypothetical protein